MYIDMNIIFDLTGRKTGDGRSGGGAVMGDGNYAE